MKEVYWHLPGLCNFRLLNQILLNLMKDYPSKFKEGYKIGSVYGTFPGAIWNGGRAVFGSAFKGDIDKIIKMYNVRGVPVRFTWTNSLLEEKHNLDTYCNMIMKLADNGKNQVLVNRPTLEEYIRKEYPGFKMISSTTKRMVNLEEIKQELEKDYYLVVLDYDLNHDETVLTELEPCADRIEILVNEICSPNCSKRAEHYRAESLSQLEFDRDTLFQCPHQNGRRDFSECRKRPSFLSNEEIERYIERGYVNFKIVGRGLSQEFVMDSYLYFLVKEEAREFIKGKMVQILSDMAKAQQRR
ncbi:MAG: hypothetical protein ACI4FZ_11560 [Lachnospiraceae bacterium]